MIVAGRDIGFSLSSNGVGVSDSYLRAYCRSNPNNWAFLSWNSRRTTFPETRLKPLLHSIACSIESPHADVIEKILQHCGLWQASAPRAPPDVDGLVLELDSSYSDSPIGSPGQADQSQELTYVDIDTFLASF